MSVYTKAVNMSKTIKVSFDLVCFKFRDLQDFMTVCLQQEISPEKWGVFPVKRFKFI